MIVYDEKILRDLIGVKKMKLIVANIIKQLNKIGFVNYNTNFNLNSKDISPEEYQIMLKLMGFVTMEQLSKIFDKKENIGEYFYVFYQLVPCFLSGSFQCVVV